MKKQLTCGSLFAGIGGFDLGFERAGIKTIWQVEIDEYCRRVLAKHFPEAERFGDIRECGGCGQFRKDTPSRLRAVDIIAGGFPCQDVSHAGRRIGIDGARSGLWREMLRIVCEVRPRFVVVENVTGLLDRGIERVLGDLAGNGFDAEWGVLSACSLGAPHPRERVFIVAHPAGKRSGQLRRTECASKSQTPRHIHWRNVESGIKREIDGIPGRVDRLVALGNAVVPQIAEWIGRRIVEAEEVATTV